MLLGRKWCWTQIVDRADIRQFCGTKRWTSGFTHLPRRRGRYPDTLPLWSGLSLCLWYSSAPRTYCPPYCPDHSCSPTLTTWRAKQEKKPPSVWHTHSTRLLQHLIPVQSRFACTCTFLKHSLRARFTTASLFSQAFRCSVFLSHQQHFRYVSQKDCSGVSWITSNTAPVSSLQSSYILTQKSVWGQMVLYERICNLFFVCGSKILILLNKVKIFYIPVLLIGGKGINPPNVILVTLVFNLCALKYLCFFNTK